MEGRIIGVDHGDRRIGLAISDPLGLTAQPLAMIELGDGMAALNAICRYARERSAVRFVVGLPLNMDSSEGPRARAARRFGEALREASGLPVEFFDERLTTRQAHRALRDATAGRYARKERSDIVAAQLLLQAYLDASRSKARG
ncbi:MAG: Holliday junction resolvase RuvX [Planctomycetota bacterium]|nr:Holliday junction resolvase RuvX [Planctomycetota bacterium]